MALFVKVFKLKVEKWRIFPQNFFYEQHVTLQLYELIRSYNFVTSLTYNPT